MFREDELARVPAVHPAMCGVVPFRERTVPLLDLAGFLELEPREDGGGMIMVTDVNDTVLAFLQSAGYRVEAFTTGEALLEALEDRTDVDLVLTDIEMPRMDGLTLCKRIKERSDLPVVVYSSLISEQNRAKCDAVGADAALSKRETGRLVPTLDGLLRA